MDSTITKLQRCSAMYRTMCKDIEKRIGYHFSPSTKLEFDNDKIGYIFSTIFFLSNRLNKL